MKEDTIFFVSVDGSKAKHAIAIVEGGRDGEDRYFGEIEASSALSKRSRSIRMASSKTRANTETISSCPCSISWQGKARQDVCCLTAPSWQGGRCAPPLHPPGPGAYSALNLAAPSNRITGRPLAELVDVRPRRHRKPGGTSRRSITARAGASELLHVPHGQPCADWMRGLVEDGSRPGETPSTRHHRVRYTLCI